MAANAGAYLDQAHDVALVSDASFARIRHATAEWRVRVSSAEQREYLVSEIARHAVLPFTEGVARLVLRELGDIETVYHHLPW